MVSKVSFFICLFALVYAVMILNDDGNWHLRTSLLSYNPWIEVSVCAMIILTMAPVFLDFRGVEIDLRKKRIRAYRSYWGLHLGTWFPLESFDIVKLTWERFSYLSGGISGVSATRDAAGVDRLQPTKRTTDSYSVYLLGPDTSTAIELGDFGSQRKARKFMFKYATVLGLPWEDKYQQRKEAAFKRRQEVEARRLRRK